MPKCKFHTDQELRPDGSCPICGWIGEVDAKNYKSLPKSSGEAKEPEATYIIHIDSATGIILTVESNSFSSNYKFRDLEALDISTQKIKKIFMEGKTGTFILEKKVLKQEVKGENKRDRLNRETLFSLKDDKTQFTLKYRDTFKKTKETVEALSNQIKFKIRYQQIMRKLKKMEDLPTLNPMKMVSSIID